VQATVSGWDWFVDVFNQVVVAATVLVVVAGVSIFASAKWSHWWYGLLALLLIWVVLFGEGAFRVYSRVALVQGVSVKRAAVTAMREQLRRAGELDTKLKSVQEQGFDADKAIDDWIEETADVIRVVAPEHEADFVTDTYVPPQTPAFYSGTEGMQQAYLDMHNRKLARLARYVERLRRIIAQVGAA
jgi:hypothetical protein